MILSDGDIRAAVREGQLEIAPYDRRNVQPASYDLTLADFLRVFDEQRVQVVDPRADQPGLTCLVSVLPGGHYILPPGQFVLGSTYERVSLPADLAGRMEGKSSLARLGLIIHVAGFVDPGFRGTLTFELANISRLPIKLYPGTKIAQIAFYRLTSPAQRPYGTDGLGSKYQNQRGPTPSRYWENAHA